jgi:hypothetical protein
MSYSDYCGAERAHYDELDEENEKLKEEIEKLRNAIRQHRDERGHDRCWMDDDRLYSVLPEGNEGVDTKLPPRECFLKNCEKFYENRQKGTEPWYAENGQVYPAPPKVLETKE